MSSADFPLFLFEATLGSSAALLLVLLLRRLVRRCFGARIAYALWWMVPVVLVATLLPAAEAPVVAPMLTLMRATVRPAFAMPVEAAPDYGIWLFAAWALGAAMATSWFARQQRRFHQELGALRRRADGLYEASSVQGLPAAMGWLRPRVVVPHDFDSRYDGQERSLLCAHEHQHIAHGDLFWNALAVLLRCVFWFNPLLHYAARHFRQDQELACDQRVIALHPKARRIYGEAMLKTQLAAQPLPLGCHWGFSHPLKERITMLGQPSPSTWRRIVGRASVFTLALACGYAAWAAQPKDAAAGSAPRGSIAAKAVLRIDGGEPQTATYVGKSGGKLVMAHTQDGHAWTVDAMVTKGEGAQQGMLMYAATVRRDGDVVGTPKIGMRSGQPGTIRIGAEGSPSDGKGVELVVTLVDGDAAATPMVSVDNVNAAQRLTPPAFPPDALLKKLDGVVVLLIDMDATGSVTGVQVEQSKPAGVFDHAAMQAAWKWRFTPPQEGGKAVAGRVRVPVTFEAGKAGRNASPKA